MGPTARWKEEARKILAPAGNDIVVVQYEANTQY
jgi:hypothetical protein